MTETNQFTGDIVNYGHDVHKLHETKRGANTIATVLGIFAFVILIAILWNTFIKRNESSKNTEKNTDITLGGNGEAIEGLKQRLFAVENHERHDYGKIMFNDGLLYGGGGRFYGPGYHGRDCGCGEREHHGCCKQKYQEVANYTLAGTTLNKTSSCDCG